MKFLAVFRYDKLVARDIKYQMIFDYNSYKTGFGFWKLSAGFPVVYYPGGAQCTKGNTAGFGGAMMSYPNQMDAVLLTNKKYDNLRKKPETILKEAYFAGFA